MYVIYDSFQVHMQEVYHIINHRQVTYQIFKPKPSSKPPRAPWIYSWIRLNMSWISTFPTVFFFILVHMSSYSISFHLRFVKTSLTPHHPGGGEEVDLTWRDLIWCKDGGLGEWVEIRMLVWEMCQFVGFINLFGIMFIISISKQLVEVLLKAVKRLDNRYI